MLTKNSGNFELSELSHGLLNPLQGVMGNAKLLLDTELTKVQREHTEAILKSAEALLGEVLALIDQPKRPAESVRSAANLELLRGKKVLLVEDNEVNQKVTTKTLAKYGVEVKAVSNGKLALELLKSNGEPGLQYELVLMDCEMPFMDGYETTKMIRRFPLPTRDIPIIAMTGNTIEGDREKCLQSGMNDYVSKPFDINDLLGALEAAIKYKASRARDTLY
jgi:two-component system sensor histidine kinase/response regulator